ncbi:phage tail protein, partial [Dickeya dianthicola]|uniref:phage tail protein n=1 Tax=Dickeya dianthicola TaxID=204039 RepID=UPI001F608AC7
MGIKYFTLLTQMGEAKLAAAIAAGKPLELTQMGVGDGGGVSSVPDPVQTKLVNEKRRGNINSLTIDPNNSNQIIAEQVIPENEGGFWLREIGLYDVDGNLIAVGNCPETYKPELKEGSGRVQTVRMILIVSHTDAVTLKFDPTVALATRSYADTLLAEHIAVANPHKQYAPLAGPALTGTPTAPTAAVGTNTIQIATTAFVKSSLDDVLTGIPQPWPQATVPVGWLKCNGQAFDKNRYPRLAQIYPSGVLPDLRGEFIRGWDDGRGVDAVRALLSTQGDAIRNITGGVSTGAAQFDGFGGAFFESGQRISYVASGTTTNNLGASDDFSFDASRIVPTANENRPRNINADQL